MLNYFLMRANMALKNEKGQGMVEYGLILALVAVVAGLLLSPLGDSVGAVFTNIKETIDALV